MTSRSTTSKQRAPVQVLFATAELAPLVRVGGLAEAASGLALALRAQGVGVHVVVPDYLGAATVLQDEQPLSVDIPEWVGETFVRRGVLPGFGEIVLVRVPGIERPHPYGEPGTHGWPDNDRRFFAFSAVVAALADVLGVDVLHVNDWHTSPALGFVSRQVASVLSIHNLAYQGQCDIGWLEVFGGLGHPRAVAYARDEACNPLAGAIRLADRVIAVSPNYAREICEREHGAGLDDLLRDRGEDLLGIRNGIDVEQWNPMSDALIAARYGTPKGTSFSLAGKRACRAALCDEVEIAEAAGPIVGFVTRLVDQKGVEFVLEAIPFLEDLDASLVVLGAGDPALATLLHDARSSLPGRVAFSEAFDLGLAHRIFAGADLYAMPSRFEPCGLAQMQAMAYGTIPVVTDVGGLHDTVVDADRDPVGGTGFVSRVTSAAGFVDALHRATRAWGSPSRRKSIVTRGLSQDWSWRVPAEQYAYTYRLLVESERNARVPG